MGQLGKVFCLSFLLGPGELLGDLKLPLNLRPLIANECGTNCQVDRTPEKRSGLIL